MQPYLEKEKNGPRVAQDPMPDKLVNGNADDELEHACIQELMEAVKDRDAKKFRQAVEALILTCFEAPEETDGRE